MASTHETTLLSGPISLRVTDGRERVSVREPIECRARSHSRLRGETTCHAPCGAAPPVAERLTDSATSGEGMQGDTAHVLSTKSCEVAQKAIAPYACALSQGPATSVRSALPRGVDAPERLRRGCSKRGAARPSSNLPAEHGPRESLVSRETPAYGPRHQPARHPNVRFPPRAPECPFKLGKATAPLREFHPRLLCSPPCGPINFVVDVMHPSGLGRALSASCGCCCCSPWSSSPPASRRPAPSRPGPAHRNQRDRHRVTRDSGA